MREAPKDGRTRFENERTQPIRPRTVFNNPDIVTQAWYPTIPSADLPVGATTSVLITRQRIVLWRGEDGEVRALDAFCQHMGADLSNGRVVGNHIQCYFHQWSYNRAGELVDIPCVKTLPKRVKTHAWPVEEKFGFIWVYSAPEAPYPVPSPPGLEQAQTSHWYLGRRRLFAHHHAMMAGGIDVQHFASVHGLDIDFDLEITRHHDEVADWNLEGAMPHDGWRARLGRFLLGDRFGYTARFAGGSIVTLAYGPNQRWRGTGSPLPPLYIYWGCTALESGVSDVDIFLVQRRSPGIFGWIRAQWLMLLTVVLLGVLKDDDVKAFPFMRFAPNKLAPEDKSVVDFMKFIEGLQPSHWGG